MLAHRAVLEPAEDADERKQKEAERNGVKMTAPAATAAISDPLSSGAPDHL